MKNFEVRSADAVFKAAMERFLADCPLPDGRYILTDLDSSPALSLPCEVTCSYTRKADLRRPFLLSELQSALLARGRKSVSRVEIEGENCFLDGTPLPLSATERALLSILLQADRPLTEGEIAEKMGVSPHSNEIGVYICRLRKKTELEHRPRLIFTQRGKGYFVKND